MPVGKEGATEHQSSAQTRDLSVLPDSKQVAGRQIVPLHQIHRRKVYNQK